MDRSHGRTDYRFPDLKFCIPRALIGKFDTYLCASNPYIEPENTAGAHMWHFNRDPWPNHARYDIVLKRDADALSEKWKAVLQEHGELHDIQPLANLAEDPRRAFLLRMAQEVRPRQETARAIDDFAAEYLKERKDPVVSEEKHKEWAAYCDKLDPPLSFTVFKLLPGADHAISKPPTSRSWKRMLAKVQEYRLQAEEQVKEVEDDTGLPYDSVPEYTLVFKPKLNGIDEAERHNPRLYRIAKEVSQQLASGSVASADFTHVALREIRAIYLATGISEPRRSLRNSAATSSYTTEPEESDIEDLTLANAQTVYYNYIAPHLNLLGDTHKRQGMRFKCPACLRRDYSKSWYFDDLLLHLGHRHGSELGSPWISYYKSYILHGATVDYLLSLRWPPNFPLLAQHHDATADWNFEDETYTRSGRDDSPEPQSRIDAPVRRGASPPPRLRLGYHQRPGPRRHQMPSAWRAGLMIHGTRGVGGGAAARHGHSYDSDFERFSEEDEERDMFDADADADLEEELDGGLPLRVATQDARENVDADTLTAAEVLAGLAPSQGRSGEPAVDPELL